jgi:hypothetical protein
MRDRFFNSDSPEVAKIVDDHAASVARAVAAERNRLIALARDQKRAAADAAQRRARQEELRQAEATKVAKMARLQGEAARILPDFLALHSRARRIQKVAGIVQAGTFIDQELWRYSKPVPLATEGALRQDAQIATMDERTAGLHRAPGYVGYKFEFQNTSSGYTQYETSYTALWLQRDGTFNGQDSEEFVGRLTLIKNLFEVVESQLNI